MATRQEINRSILNIIDKMIDKYPDLRFEQILFSLGIESVEFYRESSETKKLIKGTKNE